MKKINILIVLTLISALICSANALEVIVDDYSYGCYDGTSSILQATHPSSTSSVSARGQSFYPYFDGANLSVLQVWGYQASASGQVVAKIYGHTGIFGSTGTPNGTVLATSTESNLTTWNTVIDAVNFTFSSGFIFDASVAYYWVVEAVSGDVNAFYLGDDSTAPYVHLGASVSYASSMWTASAVNDLCFILYGQDGEAVSFNWGSPSVTINENTYVTNVTSSPSVNVTTGDVNVGGVTAEFNNTAVTAGDVTAGDVTATSSTASIESLIVNATVGENVTMTGDLNLATTAEPADFEFWFVIILILGCFALMFLPRIPIVNFVFGAFSLAVCGASLGSVILPFPWYMSFMLGISAVLCMLSGYINWRRE